jgi:ATP-dependent Clp protease ATP-binding subunit ClpB
LTDGKGRKVDFRNALLIMTSNVGSNALFELSGANPEKARKEALEALRAAFRPEFLNRVDDIVMFNPLGREQLEKIVDMQLASVSKRLADRQVQIELTPSARSLVLAEGYDPAYGARPLRRTVQRLVQDPLAREILEGRVLPGDVIRVDADAAAGRMKFERVEQQKSAAAGESVATGRARKKA